MTARLLPSTLLLALGLFLPGCATFNDNELGIIRSSGVSPRVYEKMQDGRVLHPEDVIEMTRRHVPSRYIVRQIEDTGVDYVLTREDFKRLEKAQVNHDVIDALAAASDEFAGRYSGPHHHVYVDASPYPYYDPYYYGGVGVGVVVGPHRWHHW